MLDGRRLTLIAAGLLAVSWIFYVAGNAAPSWATVSGASSDTGIGLWNVDTATCSVGLSFVNDIRGTKIGAAGAVTIVGVILNLAGAIAAGLVRTI
ncbi:unnamed protein product [Rotaria sordida]|uniref:Uncharacterized protein n=1 Tax=Rotaria sordida TaxID=392033 RepID=A0A815L8K5_9BILA|nr:unnamed protein product [Rotaria sordida]CAF1406579.1 unnamed protein product [Rotaria sordida]